MNGRKHRSCRQEELILYHFGDLGEEQMAELSGHLSTCARCRGELDALRRTLAAEPFPDLDLTEADKSRFAARVVERIESRSRFRIPSVWGSAVAAAVLVLGLSVAFLDHLPLPNRATLTAESEILPELELLQNLELLEHLDVLLELEGTGGQAT